MKQVTLVFVGLFLLVSTNLRAMIHHQPDSGSSQTGGAFGSRPTRILTDLDDRRMNLAASRGTHTHLPDEVSAASSSASIEPIATLQSSRVLVPQPAFSSETLEALGHIAAIQTVKNAMPDITEGARRIMSTSGNLQGSHDFLKVLKLWELYLVSTGQTPFAPDGIFEFIYETAIVGKDGKRVPVCSEFCQAYEDTRGVMGVLMPEYAHVFTPLAELNKRESASVEHGSRAGSHASYSTAAPPRVASSDEADSHEVLNPLMVVLSEKPDLKKGARLLMNHTLYNAIRLLSKTTVSKEFQDILEVLRGFCGRILLENPLNPRSVVEFLSDASCGAASPMTFEALRGAYANAQHLLVGLNPQLASIFTPLGGRETFSLIELREVSGVGNIGPAT